MQIELPDNTIRDLEAMLARTGGGDLAEYVDRTVKRAVFFDTVREVNRHNSDADPELLDEEIEEAVKAIRSS